MDHTTSRKPIQNTTISNNLIYYFTEVTGTHGYGLTVAFTNGWQNRQFEIDFTCDYTVSIGAPVFTGENPALHYNFEWNSVYACPVGTYGHPKGGKLSGGSILLIM